MLTQVKRIKQSLRQFCSSHQMQLDSATMHLEHLTTLDQLLAWVGAVDVSRIDWGEQSMLFLLFYSAYWTFPTEAWFPPSSKALLRAFADWMLEQGQFTLESDILQSFAQREAHRVLCELETPDRRVASGCSPLFGSEAHVSHEQYAFELVCSLAQRLAEETPGYRARLASFISTYYHVHNKQEAHPSRQEDRALIEEICQQQMKYGWYFTPEIVIGAATQQALTEPEFRGWLAPLWRQLAPSCPMQDHLAFF